MGVTVNFPESPAEDRTLLSRATSQLEQVLGGSANLVTATWSRTEDEKGRPLYDLRVRDTIEDMTATVRFGLDELNSTAQTSFRMHRLWSNLLQARNERQLKQLSGRGD